MNFRPTIALALLLAACDDGAGSYDLDGGDLVSVGKAFVEQRGCATCHQSPNQADGVLSGQSTPRPGTRAFGSNLTPDTATGLGGWADIAIVRAMRFGFDPGALPLCPPMPHYDGSDVPDGGDASFEPSESFMTDLEANAIVAYLRSLPAVSRPDVPASICPPLKDAPADMAVAAGDDMSIPPGDLAGAGPDLASGAASDLAPSPPADLVSLPAGDLARALDGGAGD